MLNHQQLYLAAVRRSRYLLRAPPSPPRHPRLLPARQTPRRPSTCAPATATYPCAPCGCGGHGKHHGLDHPTAQGDQRRMRARLDQVVEGQPVASWNRWASRSPRRKNAARPWLCGNHPLGISRDLRLHGISFGRCRPRSLEAGISRADCAPARASTRVDALPAALWNRMNRRPMLSIRRLDCGRSAAASASGDHRRRRCRVQLPPRFADTGTSSQPRCPKTHWSAGRLIHSLAARSGFWVRVVEMRPTGRWSPGRSSRRWSAGVEHSWQGVTDFVKQEIAEVAGPGAGRVLLNGFLESIGASPLYWWRTVRRSAGSRR